MGYASIDEAAGVYSGSATLAAAYFPLNGDSYQVGKRFFGRANLNVAPGASLFGFYIHEIDSKATPLTYSFTRQNYNFGMQLDFKTMLQHAGIFNRTAHLTGRVLTRKAGTRNCSGLSAFATRALAKFSESLMPDNQEVNALTRRWLAGLLLAGSAFTQTYKAPAIEQANKGVALSKKEDYPAAVQAYKRALAIDPRLPNLYLNLGLAYFKQGKFRDALAAFQKEPSSYQVVTLIGMSHFGLGEYQQAAATLKPLAAKEPDNAELAYLSAKCYLWAGQTSEAMEMFRKLLERDPDSAPVHMLMAEALDADDRENEATEEFEAAVKAGPKQPEAHFGLGYLYWKQRRYPDAEREFQAELANNPEHALSLAYLGDLLQRDGRGEQALSTLKKAEGLDKNLHVVHQDLGIYYQGAKQTDLAVKEFQEAVRTAPENYDAHYRLARIYQQLGRTPEAAKEFAIVQKLHQQKQEEPLMRISGPK